jgi:hypothetical protein
MTELLVYVAGPYTHPDPILNTRAACTVADSIMALCPNVVALVPHLTIVWHLIHPRGVEHWYGYDLRLLARCDAVFRFPGDSVGADREVDHARALGLPVFDDHYGELKEWAALQGV